MTELSIEQIKAKELEKEKLAIIAPMINHLTLRKEEVAALLTLDKKRLKNLNAKVDERFNSKRHLVSKIIDPKKPASLLYSIGKTAATSGEKIIPNKRYPANLLGVQVLACFGMAKQLYALADEGKEEGEKKQ